MNLRDLQYLVALADQRNFRRAAELCLVSQPTLSTQIRKLEDELGVTLIERSPRNVMLTPAGQDITARARRILNEAAAIKDAAKRMSAPESGVLRLGIFPTLGPYLLPHVMSGIKQRFPHLELFLTEEKSDPLLERLQSGKLDAVILALPVHDAQLQSELLFEEPFLLAVPNNHDLAARQTIRIAELANYNLLLLEDGHCLRDQALAVCDTSGSRETTGFRATSLETLRQMVMAGIGMTLIPALAAHGMAAPHARPVHLLAFEGANPSRRIALVWRKTSAVEPLLQELAAAFRSLLPDSLLDARALATIPALAAV
ncbi:LysR family transcriptional regulator [Acidisoma cellulosilytica]|uniref:LysR family transcriptional regulator n=1 Tax=Acidisoma cellulosilyticum TaxID=2802395 RepID=A0A963Z139_9PROT|nr:LysR substrate-binding domain-containing protein [Acidisoma cellulosilyticum]MCB8880918.1 LysR family transcriptional regulator [Acidisoma cellulosilyticum]